MSRLVAIIGDAGAVGIALIIVGFLMWWVLSLRFFSIDGCLGDIGAAGAKRNSVPNPIENVREASTLAVAEQRLVAWKNVLRAMVASAPLLGLLGTVGGMIETFATLHVSGLAHADASVAGGISTALLTTQLGLLVSVPGLIAARTLDRFEERRRQSLRGLLRERRAPSLNIAFEGGTP